MAYKPNKTKITKATGRCSNCKCDNKEPSTFDSKILQVCLVTLISAMFIFSLASSLD